MVLLVRWRWLRRAAWTLRLPLKPQQTRSTFWARGKQATHVADALAVAANDTTADVSDFALALTRAARQRRSRVFRLTKRSLRLRR